MSDWSGKRVTVMGLGLLGGGVVTVQYFADRGATVLVTDRRMHEDLAESIKKIEGVNVSLRLGGHEREDFTDADLVVANQAVPLDNEYLKAAREAGVPVTSGINLFFKQCRAPIVGVTGSNGKSTTAALIAHMLTSAGRRCHLGGNIGRSLLNIVDEIQPDDVVVLEISSFHLEYMDLDKLSSHVAVVTNLQPNHLDRHGTMENYAAAKRHIVEHQAADDIAILNAGDAVVRSFGEATSARTLLFGMTEPSGEGAWVDGDVVRCRLGDAETVVNGLGRMKLLGLHNRENGCAAALAATVLGVEADEISKALVDFEPLPHRLQTVNAREGVTYVNDSIATSPDSVAAALSCFDGSVILIAGGYPKGLPYEPMLEGIRRKVKLLLLIGQAADEIERAVRAVRAEDADSPKIVRANTLNEAMRIARERVVPGDFVLLSPACASYDQFRNFEERGNRFAELALNPPE